MIRVQDPSIPKQTDAIDHRITLFISGLFEKMDGGKQIRNEQNVHLKMGEKIPSIVVRCMWSDGRRPTAMATTDAADTTTVALQSNLQWTQAAGTANTSRTELHLDACSASYPGVWVACLSSAVGRSDRRLFGCSQSEQP